jgi:hypothetical protein
MLNDTNFITWKMRIKGYCMQQKLSKFLNTVTDPTDPVELEAFNERKIQAAGILTSFMGDENYHRFVNKDNE